MLVHHQVTRRIHARNRGLIALGVDEVAGIEPQPERVDERHDQRCLVLGRPYEQRVASDLGAIRNADGGQLVPARPQSDDGPLLDADLRAIELVAEIAWDLEGSIREDHEVAGPGAEQQRPFGATGIRCKVSEAPIAYLPPVAVRALKQAGPPQLSVTGEIGQLVDDPA